jgi:hypothetical protein
MVSGRGRGQHRQDRRGLKRLRRLQRDHHGQQRRPESLERRRWIGRRRHISNPLVGFEGTYSFNRANQKYAGGVSCGIPCGNISPATVSADAHEVTGDWIASVGIANLRPFALAGGGLLFNEPSSGQANTTSSTKPVFVYGAGPDWGLLPHLGLRLQYRGNLYKAPDLTKLYGATGAFTRTAEPMMRLWLTIHVRHAPHAPSVHALNRPNRRKWNGATTFNASRCQTIRRDSRYRGSPRTPVITHRSAESHVQPSLPSATSMFDGLENDRSSGKFPDGYFVSRTFVPIDPFAVAAPVSCVAKVLG